MSDLIQINVKPIAEAAVLEVANMYDIAPSEAIVIMYRAWKAAQEGKQDG